MSISKILLINPFGIGDVLFTTPVIANLKRSNPTVRIDYLSNSRTAEFLRNDPRVEKIFVYDRDDFLRTYHQSKFLFLKKWKQLFDSLRSERYDAVIDFSMNRQFGFLMLLAGAPVRIGFNYKNRGTFLTHSIPLKGYEGKHVVDYYCELLSLLDVKVKEKKLEIYTSPQEKTWARDWLAQKGLAGKKNLIAVVPGGGASWGKEAGLKRWASENYAELVGKIVEKKNVPIILFGDKLEQELCQQIARAVNNLRVITAGETNLAQFAALLECCHLAITNDGGPLHIAAALGVRSVSIFGPVDPVVYGPYFLNQHIVIQKALACQPCYRQFRMSDCQHQNCLRRLSVDDVFRKVEELL